MSPSETQQARRTVRASLATRLFIVLGLLAVILYGLSTTVMLSQSAQRGRENRETLHSLKQQAAIIRDCTIPSGKCYQRGKQQTASAVSSINRVVILAAACASRAPGQSVAEIQSCVINRLAVHKH
jgi:hypothetical protein